MSSEFIGFRGRGFWARGAEVWAHLLVQDLRAHPAEGAWVSSAIDVLSKFAHDHPGCGLGFDLDEVLSDDQALDGFLRAVARVHAKVHLDGGVSAEYLNRSLGSGWCADIPAVALAFHLDLLRRLVVGELDWTASTSPVFGYFNGKGEPEDGL